VGDWFGSQSILVHEAAHDVIRERVLACFRLRVYPVAKEAACTLRRIRHATTKRDVSSNADVIQAMVILHLQENSMFAQYIAFGSKKTCPVQRISYDKDRQV
jgi:hypothetical protein